MKWVYRRKADDGQMKTERECAYSFSLLGKLRY